MRNSLSCGGGECNMKQRTSVKGKGAEGLSTVLARGVCFLRMAPWFASPGKVSVCMKEIRKR